MNIRKRLRVMTLLTHRSKLIIVRIIPRMTETTGLIQFNTIYCRGRMTVITVQIIMCAIEFKSGIVIVIETP